MMMRFSSQHRLELSAWLFPIGENPWDFSETDRGDAARTTRCFGSTRRTRKRTPGGFCLKLRRGEGSAAARLSFSYKRAHASVATAAASATRHVLCETFLLVAAGLHGATRAVAVSLHPGTVDSFEGGIHPLRKGGKGREKER